MKHNRIWFHSVEPKAPIRAAIACNGKHYFMAGRRTNNICSGKGSRMADSRPRNWFQPVASLMDSITNLPSGNLFAVAS